MCEHVACDSSVPSTKDGVVAFRENAIIHLEFGHQACTRTSVGPCFFVVSLSRTVISLHHQPTTIIIVSAVIYQQTRTLLVQLRGLPYSFQYLMQVGLPRDRGVIRESHTAQRPTLLVVALWPPTMDPAAASQYLTNVK